MSHDKTKAAARKRMMATGEPYTAARRHALSEHNAAHGTSPVSAEDVQAAALVHRELGPDYSDAVVAAFIDKVDRAVAARVEARLADGARSDSAAAARRPPRRLTRRVARDVLAASAGALVAVGAIGLHDITSTHGSPVSKVAVGACPGRPSTGKPGSVPALRYGVRCWFDVNGQVTNVAIRRSGAEIPQGAVVSDIPRRDAGKASG